MSIAIQAPHKVKITHKHGSARLCFKGDEASHWKRPKFDPSPR